MGINLGIYWKFCLGFFVPISLIAIFIYFIITYEPLTYQGFAYPEAAIYGGWILTAFAMIQIPIWFCHSLCKEGKSVFVPNKEWGPSRPNDKLSWLQHVQEEEKTTELWFIYFLQYIDFDKRLCLIERPDMKIIKIKEILLSFLQHILYPEKNYSTTSFICKLIQTILLWI